MPSQPDTTAAVQDLISIVIPCYNQGRFLGEALESVRSQSYTQVEIIVVDDGSTDDTRVVAACYPEIRYIYQANQGLARARNAGLHASTGEYIVFLDSDDYLYPGALDANLALLKIHREYAFVVGQYHYVNADSSVITPPRPYEMRDDFYVELLKRNCITMTGMVLFRREIVAAFAGFNTSPHCHGCEDYELYLRIAQRFPIFSHSQIVAAYRRHGTNMSGKPAMMLQSALYVLALQWPFVQTQGPQYRAAYKRGRHTWRNLYGLDLSRLMLRNMRAGRWKAVYRDFLVLRPHLLPAMAWQARRAIMRGYAQPKVA